MVIGSPGVPRIIQAKTLASRMTGKALLKLGMKQARKYRSLEEIVGDDEAEDYIEGVQIRPNGVKGLVDKLELLKTLRLHPKVSDGGEHLASEIMNHLKGFKPYNYFDETKKECNRAMDKIIELYKENEHGEELVKDIEKVYGLSYLDPRAKEFLKHGMSILKGE